MECVCFPKVYDRIRNFLEADRVVSLSGKMNIEDGKAPAIIVDKMSEFTIEETFTPVRPVPTPDAYYAKEEPAPKAEKTDAKKRLWLNVSELENEDIEELLETLSFHVGETSVCFVKNGKKMLCSQKVKLSKALMAELFSFLPENCIKVV